MPIITCTSTIYITCHRIPKKVLGFKFYIYKTLTWNYAIDPIRGNKRYLIALKPKKAIKILGNDRICWGTPFSSAYNDKIMKIKQLYNNIVVKEHDII